MSSPDDMLFAMIKILLFAIFMGFTAHIAFSHGYNSGRESVQKEAISQNVGTYIVDNNNKTIFKWTGEKLNDTK